MKYFLILFLLFSSLVKADQFQTDTHQIICPGVQNLCVVNIMNSHEGLVLLYGTPEEYIRLMTKLNKTEFVVIERLELTIDDSFNGNIGKLLITYKINQSI